MIMGSMMKLKTNQNFKKTLRAKLEIKTMRIEVKILVNERTTLRFWMDIMNFKGKEREKKKEKYVSDTLSHKWWHLPPHANIYVLIVPTPSQKLSFGHREMSYKSSKDRECPTLASVYVAQAFQLLFLNYILYL